MGAAIAIGILAGVGGLYLSYWLNVASGATIVLVETGLFLLALALGPRVGLLSRRRRAVPALAPAAGSPAEPAS